MQMVIEAQSASSGKFAYTSVLFARLILEKRTSAMTKPDYSQATTVKSDPDYRSKTEDESAPVRSQTALDPCLREAQDSKNQFETGELVPIAPPADQKRLNVFQKRIKHGTDYLQRVSKMAQKHWVAVVKSEPPFPVPGLGATSRVWFTLEQTKRHVMLPLSGSLVFGHGGPGIVLSPDVDLSYEDRHAQYLSRRHAIVSAVEGCYTVADLGSRTGVYLNNQRIGLSPSRPLHLGDRVRMGQVSFVFDSVPHELLAAPPPAAIRPVLTVVASGQKLPLTPSRSLIIGRTDLRLNYLPDIDLTSYGDLARQVSRRHATIKWKEGVPYLEDLGSSFGTRLCGNLLPIGQAVRLYPGDHIWLAGCVLAYDLEPYSTGI